MRALAGKRLVDAEGPDPEGDGGSRFVASFERHNVQIRRPKRCSRAVVLTILALPA